MRLLAIVAVLAIGCSRAPSRPSDLQPQVAAFGYYGVLAAAKPAPAPAPSGKCKNCNGTGKLSDGRVAPVKCPVCDGKGVVSSAGKPACANGVCQWPTRNITP
jgi:hypothetical protein